MKWRGNLLKVQDGLRCRHEYPVQGDWLREIVYFKDRLVTEDKALYLRLKRSTIIIFKN